MEGISLERMLLREGGEERRSEVLEIKEERDNNN